MQARRWSMFSEDDAAPRIPYVFDFFNFRPY